MGARRCPAASHWPPLPALQRAGALGPKKGDAAVTGDGPPSRPKALKFTPATLQAADLKGEAGGSADAGAAEDLDPYDNPLLMPLREFAAHPVAADLLHNGQAMQAGPGGGVGSRLMA